MDIVSDLRYAFRALRRSPGFAVIAVATLAAGIGANTAIFSVINTVLLEPLSYPDPSRLVQFALSTRDGPGFTLSVPELLAFQAQTSVFEDVAAYDFGGPGVNLTGGDIPESVKAIHVSAPYFRLFGARAIVGRTFLPDEDRPSGAKVVVMSHSLWIRRYNADKAIIGKTISLGNEPYTVTGVLAQAFDPDPPADLWLPLQADPASISAAHYLRIAGRLKPGVSLSQAKAQLKIAEPDFRKRFPLFNAETGFTAWPLRDAVVSGIQKSLLILAATVGFVLLIACANVANLQLARASGRRREIAIRTALGATRTHIIRHLLAESVLLSSAGGAMGLAIGYAGVRGLLALNPGTIPRIGEPGSAVALEWRVLVFTLAVSMTTGILFGLFAAVPASRPDLRGNMGSLPTRSRSILVSTEVALAFVLLAGAGLLLRSFTELRTVKTGIDTRNVVTMDMSLDAKRFEKTAGVAQLARDVQQRVESIPGVVAAASTWTIPVENAFSSSFVIEGRPLGNSKVHGMNLMRPVSPHFFQVFRIPLLRGRYFTERDNGASQGVALVSETLARKFWPHGNPIGERISVDKYHPEFAAPPREIVGVVADVRDLSIDTDPMPMIYFPQAQVADGMTAIDTTIIPITWVIRTKGDPASLTPAIQRELRQASGGFPIARVRTMREVLGRSTSLSDFNTLLMGVFAGIALFLAAIGIYGLISYTVQQKTREIGIRMALGATEGRVRSGLLWYGMRLVLLGLAAGSVAAFGLTRFLASLLYGSKTMDPIVFAAVGILLGLIALLAAYIPARRATRVDPMVALRCE